MPLAFQWVMALRGSRRSVRPTISSMVRKPSWAMISRTSRAMNVMKFTTYSGLPVYFSRRRGSWVATPVGQVFR